MNTGGGECVHHGLRRYQPLGAFGARSKCSGAQTPRDVLIWFLPEKPQGAEDIPRVLTVVICSQGSGFSGRFVA